MSEQLMEVCDIISTLKNTLRIMNWKTENLPSDCLTATDVFLVNTLICLLIEGINLIKHYNNN